VAAGPRHFIVRSPALLALTSEGVRAGAPLEAMLGLVSSLADHLGALADTLADGIVGRMWEPLHGAGRDDEVEAVLRRGRPLLVQGVASVFADRLGAALFSRAENGTGREALRSAIERARVGAFADAAGNITRSGENR
jgi:hypothetical protein